MGPNPKPPELRFWAKVDKSAGVDKCWPWTKALGTTGYGAFTVRAGLVVGAHRFALATSLGRPIQAGMDALHSCDNPICVNPAHLREGTNQDNIDDKVSRQRQRKGVGVPQARLTEESALSIRRRFAAGETLTSLADEYSVGLATISKLINGHTWKHVGGPIRPSVQRGRRRAA